MGRSKNNSIGKKITVVPPKGIVISLSARTVLTITPIASGTTYNWQWSLKVQRFIMAAGVAAGSGNAQAAAATAWYALGSP